MQHTTAARRLSRAASLVVATTLAATALTAGPADARSSSQYRETGRAVSTDWIQVDGTPMGTSPFGNTHVGYLTAWETVRGQAEAWGAIEDFDCPPGELPWGGHHVEAFDEEPEPSNCIWKGSRYLEGSDLALTMDRKMTRATLQGQLIAYGGGHGEEGEEVGRPMADIIWTGSGGTYSDRYVSRYRDGDTTWTETWRSTSRSATMSGRLGPMGFDPELSDGSMSSYSTSSRYRNR